MASSDRLPAVSLVAVAGRRQRTLELAKEIEDRGFGGIFGPSFGDVLALCGSLAHVTERIPFGSSILPIYSRRAADVAATASYLAEISDARFHLGLGVSHEPALKRMGVSAGKPLSDMRTYVEELRAAVGDRAPMPKIVLATLRTKMLQLAVDVGDGAVWANGARSHMRDSLGAVALPTDRDFFVGNMIPTVIDDDREAAAAVNRKTLTGYVALPNYRNYWKEAGYVEEMEAIEAALAKQDWAALPGLMSDRWLSDVTLYGSAAEVREGVEAWFEAGVTTPILVPSSTSGGQLKALEELFAAFA
jgi:alkanesulfonate monooxygenase SsuD/methylene tetrahydromethanopterin reductase-like flavin-dependent oxidoreductase (luciferase family)